MVKEGIPSEAALRAAARRVVRRLIERGETLATAESCTGGWIAKLITDVAGSSAAFCGACVAYVNEVKIDLLGVSPEIIARESEVSAPCAEAMASGVRTRWHATYGASTTGYAGPTGGNDRDPVGTVYIAIATPDGCRSERFSAPEGASRTEVRRAAAMRALGLLEQNLENG